MKKLEFETSKDKFVLVDLPSYEEIEKELQFFGHDQGLTNEDLNNYFRHILPDLNKSYELSEITEEEASQIVDYYIEDNFLGYTEIDVLHSLLKSKGIHLFENPYKNHQDKDLETWYEELTFYNPFIFKL